MFSIRPAVLTEARVIQHLMLNVMNNSLGHSGLNIPEMVRSANNCVNLWLERPDNHVHFVADIDGQIVGVIFFKEYWNLVSLFVDLDHQGQGIGTALILEGLEACRSKSRHRGVALNSAPDSASFYEKLGFSVRTDIERMHDTIPMQLRFTDAHAPEPESH
jgi:GNAT superfamily N-acetyltransferase